MKTKFIYLLGVSLCINLLNSVKAQNYAVAYHGINLTSPARQEFDVETAYSRFEGNPYLNDNWLSATIITNSGKQYQNVKIKYDVLNNLLLIERIGDHNSWVITNIKTLFLRDPQNNLLHFENGFPQINNYNKETLYQVLTSSDIMVLKKQDKDAQVRLVYSSNPVTRLVNITNYFVYKNDKMYLLKRNEQSLLDLLSNKRIELLSYMRAKNFNFKNDNDIDNIIAYYNTLL